MNTSSAIFLSEKTRYAGDCLKLGEVKNSRLVQMKNCFISQFAVYSNEEKMSSGVKFKCM